MVNCSSLTLLVGTHFKIYMKKLNSDKFWEVRETSSSRQLFPLTSYNITGCNEVILYLSIKEYITVLKLPFVEYVLEVCLSK